MAAERQIRKRERTEAKRAGRLPEALVTTPTEEIERPRARKKIDDDVSYAYLLPVTQTKLLDKCIELLNQNLCLFMLGTNRELGRF